MRPVLRPLVVAAAALAALLAQPAASVADSAVGRGYQVRDDDAARIAVAEFRLRADRGEWPAAVSQLQRLLDTPPARGVVVAVEGASPPRFESAWRVALRLFESLPPDGRAAWETAARRPAEELLSRGIRLRREEDLVSAARRFPARDVRRRAHDALAHLALARGDFARCARELESLLDCVPPEDAAEPFARLAFARAMAGDAEGAARVAAVAAPLAKAEVRTPQGTVRLGEYVERMRRDAETSGRRFGSTRGFGGGPHGTNVSEPPPQVDAPSWTGAAETGARRGDENDNTYGYGDDRFRPSVVTVAQGAVLVNNGLALTAWDPASGRRLWRVETAQREPEWRDHPNAYSAVTVADGVAYAALATRSDAPRTTRVFGGKLIIHALPHRALHAVDVRSGELLWALDSERLQGRADAEELDRESAASPPLVVGDDLYVATWVFNTRYEVRLVCLDRRTGATRWRTSLVHGQQEANLFGRPVKELVTQPLAELDGVIFVPTGLGVAAAVDRVTGATVWLAEYDTAPIPPTTQWWETRDRDVTWRPSPTSATHAAVVMAPSESDWLYAFDPRTGATLWRKPQHTSASWATWFLGVMDGRAYAAGSKVFAWDLSTGRESWTKADAGRLGRMGDTARLAAGRGLLTPGAIHVPTTTGIVRIDPATGDFLDVRPVPGATTDRRGRVRSDGDLTSADGALVVTTWGGTEAYFRFEELSARLRAKIVADPDDPQLRLEAGEAFLAAGEIDEAVSCLDQGVAAVAKAPGGAMSRVSASLRSALVNALLTRARLRRAATDGPGAWADLQRAVETASEPTESVRALFALADCAAETGRDAAGDAALRRIAAEFPDVQVPLPDSGPADAAALATLRLGERLAARGSTAEAVEIWLDLLDARPDASVGDTSAAGAVRRALDAAAQSTGDLVPRRIEERARKALATAVAASDVIALHRLARVCPSPAVAGEAALAAAEIHLRAGRARECAAVLEGVVLRPQPPEILARALFALADCFRALRQTPRERAALRRVLQECPDAKLPDGTTAGASARALLADDRFADVPPSLPAPGIPLALAWETPADEDRSALQLVRVQGTLPEELQDHLLFVEDGVLRLIDGRTGDSAWDAPSGVECRMAFGAPGAVVVAGEDAQIRPRLVRVDGFRASDGGRAWTRRLTGRWVHAASSIGLVYVLRVEPDASGDRISTITALAADTGDVVAERRLGASIHPVITAAGDAVVVHEPITQGSVARRRVVTLDGATLAPRAAVEVDGLSSPFTVPVPGTSLVATTSGHGAVVAIDTTTGELAWPPVALAGRSVKSVMAVPRGIIVSDDRDGIRRLDAATGRPSWAVDLGGTRSLGYNGEAAEGDLVVATLVAPRGGSAEAVGLDATTGAERWRTPLDIRGRALPHPEILAQVVAWELNVLNAGTYDCRVDFLGRSDGVIRGSVSHPAIGKSMQQAAYVGPFVVLAAPPRPAVAVYAAEAAPAPR